MPTSDLIESDLDEIDVFEPHPSIDYKELSDRAKRTRWEFRVAFLVGCVPPGVIAHVAGEEYIRHINGQEVGVIPALFCITGIVVSLNCFTACLKIRSDCKALWQKYLSGRLPKGQEEIRPHPLD
jgi:hypothetical protein